MVRHKLFKSRILAWKQCSKRLRLQIHKRDLLKTGYSKVLAIVPQLEERGALSLLINRSAPRKD